MYIGEILEEQEEKFQIGDLIYVKETANATDRTFLGKSGVVKNTMGGLIGVEFPQSVHWFQENEIETIKEHVDTFLEKTEARLKELTFPK